MAESGAVTLSCRYSRDSVCAERYSWDSLLWSQQAFHFTIFSMYEISVSVNFLLTQYSQSLQTQYTRLLIYNVHD
jgi:hypothetical protein